MTDEVAAPQGEEVTVIKSEGTGPLNLRDAARSVREARAKMQEEPAAPIEAAPPPPSTESEPPQAVSDADSPPPVENPGETPAPEVEELPPIEAPKSWAKAERERWASLPRATQEYLAERETERERAFHQGRREVSEQRKAVEAERQQAAQVRAQYEQALPQALAVARARLAEFADIKTNADLQQLAATNPNRYLQFDAAMKAAAAAQAEIAQAQQRARYEQTQRWAQYTKEQDARFSKAVPDAADPEKLRDVQRRAEQSLKDLGFTQEEIQAAWSGQPVSLRDHRWQVAIHKLSKFDAMEAKAKEIKKAPLPPVQKPGMARPAGASEAERISSLQKQLDSASGIRALRIAKELQQAKRAGRSG